jgi:hypothetical protein
MTRLSRFIVPFFKCVNPSTCRLFSQRSRIYRFFFPPLGYYISVSQSGLEEEKLMQPALHKRGGYVSQSEFTSMWSWCLRWRQCDSEDIIYVFLAIKPVPQCVHFLVIYESYSSNYLILHIFFFLNIIKIYIDICLTMMYAQTELISFFLFNLKGFSPSIGGNSLSCYRLVFMKLRYALNVYYLCVHLHAALIHFDRQFYSLL